VREVWEHARSSAQALGVDPRVLVAQSALETGWGRQVIRDQQGRSSYNLFGIKADARWDGAAVSVSTLEYRDNIARPETARFRKYDSVAGSFNDYVDFLRRNPRYENALANSSNSEAYLSALQSAGYATDPAYADKVMAVLSGLPAATAVR
jgi:flagellar protein FlgJ